MKPLILTGDCVESMRFYLEDSSVHTCVTSPPYYGLRDYGHAGQIGLEKSPDEYVAALVSVFAEVWRVLRPDGTLWLNLGDSYSPGARKTQVAPTLRTNTADAASGKQEYLANFAVRPKGDAWSKAKNLLGIPWRVAFALQAAGWYLRQDIIWHKPNPMPESIRDRCTKAHEYIFLLSKAEKYYFDTNAIKEPAVGGAPGNKKHKGKTAFEEGDVRMRTKAGLTEIGAKEFRNKRSVWTVTTKPFKEAHSATFPPDLIEPCVLAGCPPGGTVLDPFGGAGTTGLVAQRHGRNSILCELNPAYVDIAEKRLA